MTFSEEDVGDFGTVGLVDAIAHVVRDHQRAIFLKESLVITKVIWVHLQVITEVWNASRARDFSHGTAVDGDSYGLIFIQYVVGSSKPVIVKDKAKA
jgi:hypothetical protein